MKATPEAIARAKIVAARFDMPLVIVRHPSGHEYVIGEDLANRHEHAVLAKVWPNGSVRESQGEGAMV
jgi:hypothetical protein